MHAVTTANLVSSNRAKHLPAPHLEMLITHTGMLVTATAAVDLSQCKVEACVERLDLFSESSESGAV